MTNSFTSLKASRNFANCRGFNLAYSAGFPFSTDNDNALWSVIPLHWKPSKVNDLHPLKCSVLPPMFLAATPVGAVSSTGLFTTPAVSIRMWFVRTLIRWLLPTMHHNHIQKISQYPSEARTYAAAPHRHYAYPIWPWADCLCDFIEDVPLFST